MRYLIGFVFFLAFLAFEGVLLSAGVQIGADRGYHSGFADGIQSEQTQRLSFILDRMAFYESSYKVDARGDFDGTRYLAYGLYQFHRPTFRWLSRLSGNPSLDWKNPEHQHRIAKWAVQHGYGKLWGKTYQHALRDYLKRG